MKMRTTVGLLITISIWSHLHEPSDTFKLSPIRRRGLLRRPFFRRPRLHKPPTPITNIPNNIDYSSITRREYKNLLDNDNDDNVPIIPPTSKSNKLINLRRKNTKTNTTNTLITSLSSLRHSILHTQTPLSALTLPTPPSSPNPPPPTHPTLSLLSTRFHSHSTPSTRTDPHHLSLAIEGGGMRGAVCAGMASAIACLGLTDAIDSIYGSSAGSVIGAYMVSRQMCMDVYTDILPRAKGTFVSKVRMMTGLVVSLWNNQVNVTLPLVRQMTPGMNISFVLDGILAADGGLRPLDEETFRHNGRSQRLRVVSSAVVEGEMETVVFGAADGDFFPEEETGEVTRSQTREGLMACLQASMTVPGATGPPVTLRRPKYNQTAEAFDAFCFEPMPYRSAVHEGATHVLVLRSRPDGCPIKIKPGLYEKTIAPAYFREHKQHRVARYFERGGQQYRYLEDVLTLDEAKIATEGVPVPPRDILYGLDDDYDDDDESVAKRRRVTTDETKWKKAHLLPCVVPGHKAELNALEQDQGEVLEAVRGGFAAAFDLLAPVVGLELNGLDESLTGDRVAELVFPSDAGVEGGGEDDVMVSKEVKGDFIVSREDIVTEEQVVPQMEIIPTETAITQERKVKKRKKVKEWFKSRFSRDYDNNSQDEMTDDHQPTDFFEDTTNSTASHSSVNGSPPTSILDDDTINYEINNVDHQMSSSQHQQQQQQERSHEQTLLACLPGLQRGQMSQLARGLAKRARESG